MGTIYNKGNTSIYKAILLSWATKSLRGWVDYNTTDASSISTTSTLSLNTWYHVAMTWSTTDNQVDLFINGKETTYNSQTSGVGSANADATLNSWIGNIIVASMTFDGLIDEVRVYNRILTATEIQSLFNSGAAKFNISPTKYLTSGLVGYWTMDGSKVNWATGAVTDSSGNGNTGYVTNMATSTAAAAGKIGQALSFDGVDDYVDRGTGPTSANTFSFWVYPQTTTGYFVNITDTTVYIWANAGTVTATGFSGTPTIYVNGQVSSIISAGQWQYITVTTTVAENASNLDIGRTQDANYFNGKIDEVRVYNRALSPDEIQKLYNSGR